MRVEAVLLDFDGPLCDVFHGYPAPEVAARLIEIASQDVPPPTGVFEETDPMKVLRAFSHRCETPQARLKLDRELENLERAAIAVAPATPGALDLLNALSESGVPWAVASNNAAPPIRDFLSRHGFNSAVVAGRDPADVDLMKPNPSCLLQAARYLGVSVERTSFLGDSPFDVTAALACGSRPVGFANKPGKRSVLEAAGASLIVDEVASAYPYLVEDSP